MQSQGLFDFFIKAADMQQPARTRIALGPSAKAIRQQTSAAANKAYTAEQKRRAGMTDQQRWDEDFNNHLSDQSGAGKNQYNYAFDNYSKALDDAVARGSMTAQQAAQARQHVINGVRDKQRAFHRDYLASFNGGDYTDAQRNGIRDTKIWTTHGDNGLVHFRHGDFGENTTFGGAERGYMQRDKRLAARTGRRGAQGGNSNSQAAPQTSPATSLPAGTAQANASNVTPTAPPSPITFKGGYAVNVDPGAVDWSDRGGSSAVRGMRLTHDQYAMYNNIRSQLAGAIAMQGGVDPQKARDQASMLAAQYIGDQINIANGGKAFNSWQHVEKQQVPPANASPVPSNLTGTSTGISNLTGPLTLSGTPPVTGTPTGILVNNKQEASPPEPTVAPVEQQPLVRTISDRDIAKRWGGDDKVTTNNYITSHRQNAYNNVQRLYSQIGIRRAAGASVSEIEDLKSQLMEQAQLYTFLKNQGTLPYGDKAMTDANLDYWSMDNMKRLASRYDEDDIVKWLPDSIFKY